MAQKKSRNRNAKPVEPEKGRYRGLLWGSIAAAVIAVGAALIYSYRGPNPGGEGKNTALAAQYVGSSACDSARLPDTVVGQFVAGMIPRRGSVARARVGPPLSRQGSRYS